MYSSYYRGYGSSGNDLMAMLSGAMTVIVLLSVVIIALHLAARWKLFTKAGEPGWKTLIPIYSDYVMYRLVWKTKMFWWTVGLELAIGLFSLITVPVLSTLVRAGCGIALFLINIIFYVKMARAYGQGGGFAVGLILLYPIFIMILGFGSSLYMGPEGVAGTAAVPSSPARAQRMQPTAVREGAIPGKNQEKPDARQRTGMKNTSTPNQVMSDAAERFGEIKRSVQQKLTQSGAPTVGDAGNSVDQESGHSTDPAPLYRMLNLQKPGRGMIHGTSWTIILPAAAVLFYLISFFGLLSTHWGGIFSPSLCGLIAAVSLTLLHLQPDSRRHACGALPVTILCVQRLEAVFSRMGIAGYLGFFGWMALLVDLGILFFAALYWMMLYRPLKNSGTPGLIIVVILGAAMIFDFIEALISMGRSGFLGLDYLALVMMLAYYMLSIVLDDFKWLTPVKRTPQAEQNLRRADPRQSAARQEKQPLSTSVQRQISRQPRQPMVQAGQRMNQNDAAGYGTSGFPFHPANEADVDWSGQYEHEESDDSWQPSDSTMRIAGNRSAQSQGNRAENNPEAYRPVYCPACGTANSSGTKTCANCGNVFTRRRYRGQV